MPFSNGLGNLVPLHLGFRYFRSTFYDQQQRERSTVKCVPRHVFNLCSLEKGIYLDGLIQVDLDAEIGQLCSLTADRLDQVRRKGYRCRHESQWASCQI